MKFVDYKLEKMMPTTFDSSLISHTLQTELSVNQRSRFIETVPIFGLTQTLYPEVSDLYHVAKYICIYICVFINLI